MNGIFLVFYAYGSCANIFGSNFSLRSAQFMLAVIFVGTILVAACSFGFLAALNPSHEIKRMLAKCSNLVVVGLALFTLFRFIEGGVVHAQTGSVGSELVYGFVLSGFIALPAIFNLRAFWNPPLAGKIDD